MKPPWKYTLGLAISLGLVVILTLALTKKEKTPINCGDNSEYSFPMESGGKYHVQVSEEDSISSRNGNKKSAGRATGGAKRPDSVHVPSGNKNKSPPLHEKTPGQKRPDGLRNTDKNKGKNNENEGVPNGSAPMHAHNNLKDLIDLGHRYFFDKYEIDKDTQTLINEVVRKEVAIAASYANEYLGKSDEEKLKLGEESIHRMDTALLEALGEEKYAAFIYYQDTRPLRALANLVSDECALTDVAFSTKDTDNLIDLLNKHRITFLSKEMVGNSEELKKIVVDSIKNKSADVIQDAQQTLTGDQMIALKRILNQVSSW